ncbi:helix-turn-helix domain-containing protein [Serinibacter salmoneus]|uniref:Excisionase family DNA binding protein n=1 Tax=Serinibacter salmoneus TaxID=556530 RepID=A0A2A9D1Y1_9MICO|nr:helix-turn-helix domain-containing protein [Serinibacter salmoneus]PFG20663.1 excisionase family DNA binding protein [Serinibacter salmoneus]
MPNSPRSLGHRTTRAVLPPEDPASLDAVSAALSSESAVLVGPDGTHAAIPPEIQELLVDVVSALRNGDAVTVAPIATRLTTSQAADILGVSRPTLVKLLQDGAIPYEQPRRHRLLRLDDVLAYRDERSRQRAAKLTEMTRQAAADGLYEDTPEDYLDALRDQQSPGAS